MAQDHDPLARQAPDEPRFVGLARDWSIPELIRIWCAIRRRDASLIDAIAARLKKKMMERPYHPKDMEHVISAQKVATDMDLWLIEHSRKPVALPEESVS